uniref:Retrotransposon protein n=1 Tax=Ascaris lumbricoides TaxID=6252 RepID=A0A0M3IHB8_ASCLU
MYGDSEIESAPLGLKADCYEDFAENVYVFRRQFYEGQKRFFAKDEKRFHANCSLKIHNLTTLITPSIIQRNGVPVMKFAADVFTLCPEYRWYLGKKTEVQGVVKRKGGFNLTLKFWVMFIIMADVMDVAESRPQGFPMNENPTHGMHDAAVVDTVVAEDKESSFMELPPLVEDNDGIGVFIDTGRLEGSAAHGNVQGTSGIYVCRTDHVEDCDQSAVLAKLLDAQNVYMTILEQFILRIEQAIKTNRQNQKAVTVELKRALEQDSFMDKKKVPLQLFLPPYFRDKYDMVPSLNAEAKRRLVDGVYDSLIKEEKKCVYIVFCFA